jgi:tRNA G18 (ribose-2'-O)-methylase SpoU
MAENLNMVVILNNIRSSENVGSIFRTADAFGVKKIYLCGYTPTPLDRFNRKNTKLTKASLGAEEFVAWEKCENLKDAIGRVDNFSIIAVEQSENSIPYTEIRGRGKVYNLALVFGNETEGLSEEDLKLCDVVAEIPMHGKKESLNVAVSVGIVLSSLT